MVPSQSRRASWREAANAAVMWNMIRSLKPPGKTSDEKTSLQQQQQQQQGKEAAAFGMVVTPGRIPQFIIPSLEVVLVVPPPATASAADAAGRDDATLGVPSLSRTLSQSDPVMRRRHGAKTASGSSAGDLLDASDPLMRAAMSLPHLPKSTTPYGFPTVTESPHTRRKESLYFESDHEEQGDACQMVAGEAAGTCGGTVVGGGGGGLPLYRSRSNPVPGQARCGAALAVDFELVASRAISWETIPALTVTPPDDGFFKKPKTRFRGLIRKHLPSIKRMKQGSGGAKNKEASQEPGDSRGRE
ncbi:uncharacterized protein LOC116942044 [Petromyzon marinus]|uniref:Uncharacterized protein LOC116942044 n=1 Tax=Petromyzon marinus TaxID=7757 RepID=A0AAJ7WTK8_PETMA|nr:uncharacterized protein LOC116942044 [Petromyzon marinus]